jgi:hypothetical protein
MCQWRAQERALQASHTREFVFGDFPSIEQIINMRHELVQLANKMRVGSGGPASHVPGRYA